MDITFDSCMLTVLIKERFDNLRLLLSSQLVIPLELADHRIGIDIDGEALSLLLLGVVDLDVDGVFSFIHLQEAVETLVVSLHILSIVELVAT